MLSGRRLDLLDPSPLDIEIEDIAHGLARVARWNGQTRGAHAFSVAQHSIVVERILAETWPGAAIRDRLGALLHDAAEYVIGDMISPFKNAIGADYRTFENRLTRAIRIRFGLTPDMPESVKKRIKTADQISAYLEAVGLAGFDHEEAAAVFGRPPERLHIELLPLSATDAQTAFLDRFSTLMLAIDAETSARR
jgi:hypothetical protein